MKYVIFGVGVLTGLAFSRIPHYIDKYAVHSLPPEYEGPKVRRWKDGIEQH